MDNSKSLDNPLRDFYLSRFEEFGISAQGVGWGPKNNQAARFQNLTKYWNLRDASILDLGAGTADLFEWLVPHDIGAYIGLELMPFYCDAARKRFSSPKFEILERDLYAEASYPKVDFGIASGTFYLATDKEPEVQYDHVLGVLHRLKRSCDIGFAVNFLSDTTTFRDSSLFYAKSERILEMARGLSRRVILSHLDFPFEFTLYVWVDDQYDTATSRYSKP